MEKQIRCPNCAGINPIIDRFNHMRFYDCPLCKGKGKIKIIDKMNKQKQKYTQLPIGKVSNNIDNYKTLNEKEAEKEPWGNYSKSNHKIAVKEATIDKGKFKQHLKTEYRQKIKELLKDLSHYLKEYLMILLGKR